MVKNEVQPALLARSIHFAVQRMRFEQTLQRKNNELESSNRELQLLAYELRHTEERFRLVVEGAPNAIIAVDQAGRISLINKQTEILFGYQKHELIGQPLEILVLQREYLDVTLRNVSQLKYMIDDLLDASRAETSKVIVKRSAISTLDVIEQCVLSQSAVARAKNISIKTELASELPLVYADAARISQVMTNLLDNAIKFSPANTSVTVRAKPTHDDRNMVCIAVADCGCGIAPEHAERVFDRLYQVQNRLQAGRRGLGLGLYICKELVTLHGGWIWVDTDRKSGSRFISRSLFSPSRRRFTARCCAARTHSVELRLE
jgi:signal transduction histidine kinase